MVKGRGKECKVSQQTCIKLPIVNKISLFLVAVGEHKHLRRVFFSTFFAFRHPWSTISIFGGTLDAKIGLKVNESEYWRHP